MTDMKLAVVPVVAEYLDAANRTTVEVEGVYGGVTGGYFLSSFGNGKLTSEQIENMAREFYSHIQSEGMVHLLYCDEEVEIFIEAMRKSALLVGFGVEA